jgi:hypothetical protein
MEKKSLGRGLEDVSNVFLSRIDEKSQNKTLSGFSPLIIREETCASCIHLVWYPSAEPKCRIFTLESEQYGVPRIDTIDLSQAKHCKHFQPITAMNEKKIVESKSKDPDPAGDEGEVEEVVRVHRRIAYLNTENAQKNIRRALFKHFEDGYRIKSMTLRKVGEVTGHIRKETIEEVTIFIKGL